VNYPALCHDDGENRSTLILLLQVPDIAIFFNMQSGIDRYTTYLDVVSLEGKLFVKSQAYINKKLPHYL
jgi:hypothetical protein